MTEPRPKTQSGYDHPQCMQPVGPCRLPLGHEGEHWPKWAAPLRCVRCGITMQAGEERKCSRSNFSLWCSERAAPRAEGLDWLESQIRTWHGSNEPARSFAERILSYFGAAPQAEGLDEVIEALRRIKRDEGKVCDEYEICEHRSCASSYAAWAIADQALRQIDQAAATEPG